MVARYALSMQPKLKLLLNQEEVSALSRNVAYFNYINATYESDIARLGAQLQERARTEEALKLESNSLQTLRFENDSELARLKQLHSDYRLLVDSIEQRMAHGNNRVEQLQGRRTARDDFGRKTGANTGASAHSDKVCRAERQAGMAS